MRKGACQEVDLHEYGERCAFSVPWKPRPTKGLKSGNTFWVVKKTNENGGKVTPEFVYVY